MNNQSHFLSFTAYTLFPHHHNHFHHHHFKLADVDFAFSISKILIFYRQMVLRLHLLKFLLLLALNFLILLFFIFFMIDMIVYFLSVFLGHRHLISLDYSQLLIFNLLCLCNLRFGYLIIYRHFENLIL